VQGAIESVRRHLANGHVYVQISGGTLLVKKLSLIRQYEPLAHYVVLCLTLFDQALLTRDAGIEFLDRPAPALGPPICQICGDEIAADLVQCKSCKTPHHKECWLYYGACSTYGCRERRYTLPVGDRVRRAS
jgi:hypothetical protein